MSEIAQFVAALAAAGALVVSIWNTAKIREVHLIVNSRLTELLELTRKSSKAEGLKEGREER